MIAYGKHSINQQDIEAVQDVLEHHFLTQGEKVPEFEKLLSAYTGASFCTAVNSGTSGLHVACLALNIGKGDIVWTSPNSFVASANCALYCGASVDFVDINPISRNMCPDKLKEKLQKAHATNSLPKAIVVVHFAGKSCPMQTIYDLCQPLGIAIIEDAAHGLGGCYHTEQTTSRIGSCEFSDICVLSFHPVKSITTAEGGAITTNNAQLAKRAKLFASHGITKDIEQMNGEIDGNWYYQQLCLGYNYRMSDLHAALGISQLSRIDVFIAKRRKIAASYLTKLAGLAGNLLITLPSKDDLNDSSWHLFMIELNKHDRKDVYNKLHTLGIGVNVHYIPIHFHPYYKSLGFEEGQFPASEKFYKTALTLPLFADLTNEQQDNVVEALKTVLV
jgi:UDP-4-amino-4,6-dideoxy-N-acetyl-beta-L-altrosamine transaminase